MITVEINAKEHQVDVAPDTPMGTTRYVRHDRD
jgi:hypothetical protein